MEKGIYLILARANASTASTAPIISIQGGGTSVQNNGAVGGSVCCYFYALVAESKMNYTITFSNVTSGAGYNDYVIIKFS